jgi:hypothetical protein
MTETTMQVAGGTWNEVSEVKSAFEQVEQKSRFVGGSDLMAVNFSGKPCPTFSDEIDDDVPQLKDPNPLRKRQLDPLNLIQPAQEECWANEFDTTGPVPGDTGLYPTEPSVLYWNGTELALQETSVSEGYETVAANDLDWTTNFTSDVNVSGDGIFNGNSLTATTAAIKWTIDDCLDRIIALESKTVGLLDNQSFELNILLCDMAGPLSSTNSYDYRSMADIVRDPLQSGSGDLVSTLRDMSSDLISLECAINDPKNPSSALGRIIQDQDSTIARLQSDKYLTDMKLTDMEDQLSEMSDQLAKLMERM